MSSSSHNWLSLNLKTGLLIGSASLSSIGTASGLCFNSGRDVLETVKNSTQPIVAPFQTGYSKLSEQLDSFSKKGYNVGIDAHTWVSDNLNRSKLKTGGKNIYGYLSEWYTVVKDFAKSAHTTISDFFKDWDNSRETIHVVFKALGNSFSLLGGLMGSFESDGESKLKILFEVIGKPRFKEFMTQVSTMVSKNPNLMSSLKDNDVMDVLSAFRQDEDTVVDTLKNLNTEGEGKVDRDKLMNALKLYSLMDRAKSMQSKAQSVIAKQDKEAAKALVTEIQKILGEIKGIIDSQEQQATE